MNGWTQTLDELDALASTLSSDGWETVATQAGDTSVIPPDAGDDDWFGLSMTVPGDDADRIERLVERCDLDEYDVFRRVSGERVFLVVRYLDADARAAVLVAATYARREARPVARAAEERGSVGTRLRRLDGTPVATFAHGDYQPFLPE